MDGPGFEALMEIDILQCEKERLMADWTIGNYEQYRKKIEALEQRIHELRYGTDNPFRKEVLK